MQDFGKIVIGIIVFLALLSIPIMVSQASGKADYVPELQLPTEEDVEYFTESTDYFIGSPEYRCVESVEYMRVNHMKMLYDWRAWAVRDDADGDEDSSYYEDKDGNLWFMSLSETCLGCHTDRDVFCNQCHEYAAIQPNCWNCHNDKSDGS